MADRSSKQTKGTRHTDPKVRTAQRAARVLQNIAGELRQGHNKKATRMLWDAEAHNLFPEGAKFGPWLTKTQGKDVVRQLVHASATFPCFYCKKGHEKCEDCEGTGGTAIGRACARCLGLSVTPCGFCDGSGWVTINCMPEGLRPAVVAARTAEAREQLKTILVKPAPKTSLRNPVTAIKQSARQLLELNRLMGVFENTVTALKHFQQAGTLPKSKIGTLLKTCVEAGVAAETRVRRLLEIMAASARQNARAGDTESVTQGLAQEQAEFYDELSKSKTFAGTALEHPFLQQAAEQLLQKAARGSAQRRPTSKPKPADGE